MKLKEIYAALMQNEAFRADLADTFYSHIVFDEHNHQFNTGVPVFQGKPTCYDQGRSTALTGEEEIKGRFFLFQYIEHYPEIELFCLASIEDVEAFMQSERGISNSFTTLLIPVFEKINQ